MITRDEGIRRKLFKTEWLLVTNVIRIEVTRRQLFRIRLIVGMRLGYRRGTSRN